MKEIINESAKIKKTLAYLEDFIDTDNGELHENVETLLNDYKKKLHRLYLIIKQSDNQQLQLMKLNEELDKYKNNLEQKVEEEILKRREKEEMLLKQSRMAAMGEMIDAVAHQWLQPINIISLQSSILDEIFKRGKLDKDYIVNFQSKIQKQIMHMSDTLNTFRNFVRPSTKISTFDVDKMISKVLLLVKDEFIKNRINIETNVVKDFRLSGNENEFIHLIINIINNAKDAFNEKNINDRKITINILDNDNIKSIELIDNAGGIPLDVINDIFKANVTTKEDGKGTGIGLYMSSLIAQKYNGILSVENVENGAKFTFSIY